MFSKPIAADEAFKIIKADYEQRHQQHYTQSIDSKGIPVVAFNQSAPLDTVVCIQSKKGFDVWRISTNEVHLPRKTKAFVTTSENIETHTSEASSLRLEIADMLKTNSDHAIRKKKDNSVRQNRIFDCPIRKTHDACHVFSHIHGIC